MKKLLGAVCVLLGGAWAWRAQLSAARRRRDTLAGITAGLGQMAEEIRMARTPMPALLACLGRSRRGPERDFFRRTAEALRQGVELPQAWHQAVDMLDLPPQALAVLEELGQALRGDEEKVCKAISLAIKQLEKQLAEWDERRPEAEKQTTALWFSASALLVILLI